jgi:hypothetical protein
MISQGSSRHSGGPGKAMWSAGPPDWVLPTAVKFAISVGGMVERATVHNHRLASRERV